MTQLLVAVTSRYNNFSMLMAVHCRTSFTHCPLYPLACGAATKFFHFCLWLAVGFCSSSVLSPTQFCLYSTTPCVLRPATLAPAEDKTTTVCHGPSESPQQRTSFPRSLLEGESKTSLVAFTSLNIVCFSYSMVVMFVVCG